MRQNETTHGTECDTCSRTAALKARGDLLERFISNVSGPGHNAEITPRQEAALIWHAEIGACLRREMAPHPKCAECGILMGPGHLEAGIMPLCGTCATRRVQAEAGRHAASRRSAIGIRGWLGDRAGRS